MTITRPTTPYALACGLGLLLAAASATAANFAKPVYDGAKEDIGTTYRNEREQCNSLAGNAKDVCVRQAKGHEKIALAQLQANYSGDPEDEVKLFEARQEAWYDVAIEKCDDLAGQAKDVCVREAKTERDKTRADVKLAKRVHKAAEADAEARMKADYKLARTRCDGLAGDSKDVCVASAKARFQER